MTQPRTLDQLIGSVNDRLTRTDRRIASLVLEDPTRLAFGTVADLAAQAQTSGPSIVRFAGKLGFDGFTALQDHVRRSLSAQLARPTDRIRGDAAEGADSVLSVAQNLAIDSIQSVVNAFGGGNLQRMATPIAEANSVYIVSGEIGRAAANILASALGLVRSRVRLIDDVNLDVGLASAGTGDVAVVLDFLRYKRAVIDTATLMNERGLTMLAITDNALSPLASIADQWVGIAAPAVGPFDSSVAAVMAAELLVAEVARQLRADATNRLDSVEALWLSSNHFYQNRQEAKDNR